MNDPVIPCPETNGPGLFGGASTVHPLRHQPPVQRATAHSSVGSPSARE